MSIVLDGDTGITTPGLTNTGSETVVNLTTTGNTILGDASTDTLNVGNGGLIKDASGNVGVGVTPSAWDSSFKASQVVNSSLSATAGGVGNLNLAYNAYYNSGWKFVGADYANMYQNGSGQHRWLTSTASGTAGAAISFTQAMTLDASGNLLVGTTSTAALDGIFGAIVGGSSRSTGGVAVECSNSQWVAYTNTDQAYIFYDSRQNLERARINSSGNLLVGTTSPATGSTSTFQSRSSTNADFGLAVTHTSTDGNVRGLLVSSPNSSSDDGYLIIGSRSTGDRFFVRTSGNVQNTNNSYGAISDVKLKENIVDATPKLEKLNQVRVVNYNLIGESHKQIGVIAQELEQVFPGMVEEALDRDAEGNDLGTTTKSVKYSVFVPMLIKAIQEQQVLITQLTARITALESA